MPRVESSDPDRMVYRSGGGCLSLFGLPFLLVGVFVMASPWLGEKCRLRDSKTQEPMPAVAAVLFGGLFAALGAGLMFGRSGKELDRRTDTLLTWWGLLVPFRRKEHRLSAFQCVSLRREVRRSKNSTYTVYPVRLEGGGMPHVTLEEPRDPVAARAVAEEAAKFLGRTLVDASTGREVARRVGELDESVRERSRRTGERPEVPPPPAGARCRTRVVADTLCVEIPALGLRKAHVVALIVVGIVALLFTLGFLVPIASDGKMPAEAKVVALCFVGFFFVAVPALVCLAVVAKSVRVRRTVEVSPRELRVTTQGLLRRREVVVPSDELEEIAVVPARTVPGARRLLGEVVLARSDRVAVCFGEGLSSEELAWLRALVWNVVSA